MPVMAWARNLFGKTDPFDPYWLKQCEVEPTSEHSYPTLSSQHVNILGVVSVITLLPLIHSCCLNVVSMAVHSLASAFGRVQPMVAEVPPDPPIDG